MAISLPDQMHEALDSLCIPDSDRTKNDQLARIQQLQIAYRLEHHDERPAFEESKWWCSPPGSVSLVYALFVARQFFVRCAYHGGHVGLGGRMYDPRTITKTRTVGTRFDLAVAKHVFDYFLAESARRWEAYAADNAVPRTIEFETQFVHGLWEGVVPKEDPHGHAVIVSHIARLESETKIRFANYGKAPYPHDAVTLSANSAGAYRAGHVTQATLDPTIPRTLQGGAS